MERSYEQWSRDVLERAAPRPSAGPFLAAARDAPRDAPLDEATASALARTYTEALHAFRAAGYSDCTPGRFLMPGEMEGSPALTFAPLPGEGRAPRGSLGREFERRFEAYKARVVKPFFRDHFSRIDRQVVLVDALGAIHHGPRAVEDLRLAMTDLLGAFRPGRSAWLTSLLMGRRVERILFAASKADHIHHTQHPRLTAIMEALVEGARRRADFAGARTRGHVDRGAQGHHRAVGGAPRPAARHGAGPRARDGARGPPSTPGDLPQDPAWLLDPARDGAERWLDADYAAMRFAPAPLTLKPGDGPPHIRLDKAAQFLIGDRL